MPARSEQEPRSDRECGKEGARAAEAEQREPAQRPREIGGPKDPDPTRYGDWQRAGRCIDF